MREALAEELTELLHGLDLREVALELDKLLYLRIVRVHEVARTIAQLSARFAEVKEKLACNSLS